MLNSINLLLPLSFVKYFVNVNLKNDSGGSSGGDGGSGDGGGSSSGGGGWGVGSVTHIKLLLHFVDN